MDSKDTFFSKKLTIKCNGILLDLSSPKVLGILNHTPDSFYDGGRYMSEQQIINRIEKLINEGADIIDVGCYSSRPGAADIPAEEEKLRLANVLQTIRKIHQDAIVSVDTFRSEIAAFAVQEFGVALINDISAGLMDKRMMEVVGRLGTAYIMMHMKGTPKTMQQNAIYRHLMQEIVAFFTERTTAANKHNIVDIIIDPGFGFGKTTAHNFEILRNLNALNILEQPVMVGISRKSMIYKTLNNAPDDALNGTTVLHTLALMNGASLLRVHDVKEAREAIELVRAYKGNVILSN